jgi:hypothetical protein
MSRNFKVLYKYIEGAKEHKKVALKRATPYCFLAEASSVYTTNKV